MKGWLVITTLGVGFLAGLGIAAVRGNLWLPPVAPVQDPAVLERSPAPAEPLQTSADVAAAQPQAPPPDPKPVDPESAGRDGDTSDSAPTYEQQSAAHDRAVAHGARSR
jgi:hypothetical protein